MEDQPCSVSCSVPAPMPVPKEELPASNNQVFQPPHQALRFMPGFHPTTCSLQQAQIAGVVRKIVLTVVSKVNCDVLQNRALNKRGYLVISRDNFC